MTQHGGEQGAREKHRGVPHFKEQSGGDAHGVLRPPARPCNERPGQPRQTPAASAGDSVPGVCPRPPERPVTQVPTSAAR